LPKNAFFSVFRLGGASSVQDAPSFAIPPKWQKNASHRCTAIKWKKIPKKTLDIDALRFFLIFLASRLRPGREDFYFSVVLAKKRKTSMPSDKMQKIPKKNCVSAKKMLDKTLLVGIYYNQRETERTR
jgi:hypothetical protein